MKVCYGQLLVHQTKLKCKFSFSGCFFRIFTHSVCAKIWIVNRLCADYRIPLVHFSKITECPQSDDGNESEEIEF